MQKKMWLLCLLSMLSFSSGLMAEENSCTPEEIKKLQNEKDYCDHELFNSLRLFSNITAQKEIMTQLRSRVVSIKNDIDEMIVTSAKLHFGMSKSIAKMCLIEKKDSFEEWFSTKTSLEKHLIRLILNAKK